MVSVASDQLWRRLDILTEFRVFDGLCLFCAAQWPAGRGRLGRAGGEVANDGNTPGGAFRMRGVTQVTWGAEVDPLGARFRPGISLASKWLRRWPKGAAAVGPGRNDAAT